MSKSYKDIIADTSSNIAKMRKDIPEVLQGFNAMAHSAGKGGALSTQPCTHPRSAARGSRRAVEHGRFSAYRRARAVRAPGPCGGRAPG